MGGGAVPRIRGTILGVPIIRIEISFLGGGYWGPRRRCAAFAFVFIEDGSTRMPKSFTRCTVGSSSNATMKIVNPGCLRRSHSAHPHPLHGLLSMLGGGRFGDILEV